MFMTNPGACSDFGQVKHSHEHSEKGLYGQYRERSPDTEKARTP